MKAACAALLAATLFATQAVADDEEMIDKRLAANPTGQVEVSNVAGSVNITGWGRNEVHVTGELARGVERLEFTSSGDRTVVKVVLKRGTKALAEEYLKYLYSKEGQEIVARNFYRPRDAQVAAKYGKQFPSIPLATVQELGGWTKLQAEHFNDGGVFDQINKR